jgi:soluble lytic murein transglycosylase
VALGLPQLARRELDVVKDGLPRDYVHSLFLLTAYSRMEGYAAAFRFAQTLAQAHGGVWFRYLFPQAYWSTVQAQAQTKQLDPYFVLALIRQESVFNPEAVSPAHAYGLMQLLPKTAARVTETSSVSPNSLLEPALNISAGTAYLRQLLDRYDGNAAFALAAYNAGESAVDKWRTRYTQQESDEFVENISFRETRNYVKLVLRNYRTYRRLYSESSGL